MATTVGETELLALEKPVARVSWGGIFVGLFCTIALGLLFVSLGAAIGLTSLDPARGFGGSSPLLSGIWLFASIVVSTFLGAMLSTRVSTLLTRRDASVQGITVWAFSLLAMLAFSSWFAANSVQATSQLAGSALEAAGQAAQAAPLQQQDLQNLQQQLQQGAQGGQLQQQATQAAESAADVGAALGWWFFASALGGMLAGLFGGAAGLPRALRKREALQVRRTATARV